VDVLRVLSKHVSHQCLLLKSWPTPPLARIEGGHGHNRLVDFLGLQASLTRIAPAAGASCLPLLGGGCLTAMFTSSRRPSRRTQPSSVGTCCCRPKVGPTSGVKESLVIKASRSEILKASWSGGKLNSILGSLISSRRRGWNPRVLGSMFRSVSQA